MKKAARDKSLAPRLFLLAPPELRAYCPAVSLGTFNWLARALPSQSFGNKARNGAQFSSSHL